MILQVGAFEKSIFRCNTRLTFTLHLCNSSFSDFLMLEYPSHCYSFSVTSD